MEEEINQARLEGIVYDDRVTAGREFTVGKS